MDADPDPEVLVILESVGLAELAPRFATEDIDGPMLCSLTDGDLAELGLSPEQRLVLLARLRPGGSAAPAADSLSAPLAIAAAERALQRSALGEAAGFLDQAEARLSVAGEGAPADPLRLRVLIARSALARVQLGIASDEAGRLGRQVLELARKLREPTSELMALTGLYTHALVRAEYFVAGKWAELLSERAAQAQDATFRMIGRRGTGVMALHTGSLATSVLALREAFDGYDEARHLPLAYAHGYDHAEICAAFLSFALWLTGDPVGARAMSAFSVSHSQRIGHAHSQAQALVFRSMLMAVARDWEACRAAGRAGEALGREQGLSVMGTASGFFATVAELVLAPQPPSAAELKQLRHTNAEFRKVNPFNYQQVAGLMLATIDLKAGALDEAAEALQRAEAMQARTREIFLAPELLRMRAQILRARGDEGAARLALAEALESAHAMGANMFALGIACDMAELEPVARNIAQLTAARDRLVSADGGADLRRCGTILGAAAAEAGPRLPPG